PERDRVPQQLVVLELVLAPTGVALGVVEQLVDGGRNADEIGERERRAVDGRIRDLAAFDGDVHRLAAKLALATEQHSEPIARQPGPRPDLTLTLELGELLGDGRRGRRRLRGRPRV